MMSARPSHAAHGVVIEIGSRRYTMRGVFATARAIEERYGTVRAFGQSILSTECPISDMADALQLFIGADQITAAEVERHFDEVGIAGVATELSMVIAQLMRGFQSISDEVEEAKSPENPPMAASETVARKPRSDRGKPRGPRTATAAFPGETSSQAPQNSEFSQASSGEPRHSNSPASGAPLNLAPQPMPLMNGAQPQTQPTAPPSCGLFTDPSQGAA
jgi:hypothetical protein